MRRIDEKTTLAEYRTLIERRMLGDHSARQDPVAVIARISAADPSRNKRYTAWILRAWLKGGIRFLEDLPRTKHALSIYDRFKRHLPLEQRDINRIKGLGDLENIIAPYEGQKTGKELKAGDAARANQESDIIYDGPEGKIIVPKTEFASCFWGRGTRWCTASTSSVNYFDTYNDKGPLFILLHQDGRKWQLHLETEQYMDELDDDLDLDDLLYAPLFGRFLERMKPRMTSTPEEAVRLAKLIGRIPEAEPVIMKCPKACLQYAAKVLKRRWPEAEDIIARDAFASCAYASRVVRGPFEAGEAAIAESGQLAFEYAVHVTRQPFPAGEKAIMEKASWALHYAQQCLAGRFPSAEPVIAQDAASSARYARYVLRERFPEGEPAIARSSPDLALLYAETVIKDRFPEAEDMIASEVSAAWLYAKDILKGRFKKAETLFARRPDFALAYANEILKGRWPEAEETLLTRSALATTYAKEVLKARWPELEEKILSGTKIDPWEESSAMAAVHYAREIIGGPWPEAEELIRSCPEAAHDYDNYLSERQVQEPAAAFS